MIRKYIKARRAVYQDGVKMELCIKDEGSDDNKGEIYPLTDKQALMIYHDLHDYFYDTVRRHVD